MTVEIAIPESWTAEHFIRGRKKLMITLGENVLAI